MTSAHGVFLKRWDRLFPGLRPQASPWACLEGFLSQQPTAGCPASPSNPTPMLIGSAPPPPQSPSREWWDPLNSALSSFPPSPHPPTTEGWPHPPRWAPTLEEASGVCRIREALEHLGSPASAQGGSVHRVTRTNPASNTPPSFLSSSLARNPPEPRAASCVEVLKGPPSRSNPAMTPPSAPSPGEEQLLKSLGTQATRVNSRSRS